MTWPCGFGDAEARSDIGQQAHRDELGGADPEPAEGQGEHRQPAHRRRRRDDGDGGGRAIEGNGHRERNFRMSGLTISRAARARLAIVVQSRRSTASTGVSQLPPTHPTFGLFR